MWTFHIMIINVREHIDLLLVFAKSNRCSNFKYIYNVKVSACSMGSKYEMVRIEKK